jgi:hypothetical protein
LNHIRTIWTKILGGKTELMRLTDAGTVKLLQSRAPKACLVDRDYLKEQMKSHKLFPLVVDTKEREDIWQRICQIDLLIPTLYTFFEDLKYLAICHKVVQNLILRPKSDTVASALENLFTADDTDQVNCESSEASYICHTAPPQQHFQICYQQLWLFAMRHWWEILTAAPRRALERCVTGARLLPYLADIALEVGFKSDHILDLAQRPRAALSSAPQSTRYLLSEVTTATRRRCGIPFGDDLRWDQGNLFWNRVNKASTVPNAGLSLLVMRRSFYVAFFSSAGDAPMFDGLRDSQSQVR